MRSELEPAEKAAEYFQKIARQTGDLFLRETEELSHLITRLRCTESSLRENEEKLRNIIEHSNELFYVHDTDHVFLYVSPQCMDFFGYPPEEMKIRWTELVTDNPINRIGFELTEKAIRTGERQKPYLLEGKRKNGELILLEINESPITNRHGRVIAITGAARDVTEREKMETELRQAKKMEAIGTLTGGIAHDFNNILAMILGNAELALANVPELNPAQKNLQEIFKACLRARDVVRQLLCYSRKTEMALTLKPVKIDALVREALTFIQATIPPGIVIRQHFAENSETILADATQIHQLLINLSTNAIDAMHETGGSLEFRVENIDLKKDRLDPRTGPGRYVKLTVRDTGEGIPRERIDRIFDPYFTTKAFGRGTGMGLAVVHGIVEAHGGKITVSSTPGKGSVFDIFFQAVETEAPIETIPAKTCPTGQERILFVDDQDAIVELYKTQLGQLGYRVEGLTDATKALKQFTAAPDQYDLIITDMTMPGMSGDRLALAAMQACPGIPIILCTGYHERISAEEARRMGIRAFVMKPVEISEMAGTIRTVLDEG